MLCFRGRTFCASPGCKNKCGAKPPATIKADAERWWGKPNQPISWAWYCDENGELVESLRSPSDGGKTDG